MFIMFCRLLLFFFLEIRVFHKLHISGISPESVSNIFDPGQIPCFVWPDLGRKCLQNGYQQITLEG